MGKTLKQALNLNKLWNHLAQMEIRSVPYDWIAWLLVIIETCEQRNCVIDLRTIPDPEKFWNTKSSPSCKKRSERVCDLHSWLVKVKPLMTFPQ